jgi:small subunit ribosomal protein S9
MSTEKVFYATGKRKSSAARVFLRPGKGNMEINGRNFNEYLQTAVGRVVVFQPFVVTETKNKFDVFVTVSGGGTNGQAEAIRHGVSRALLAFNEELRPALKKAGLLTRDAREVERKKYGKHKARRSTQFSKR